MNVEIHLYGRLLRRYHRHTSQIGQNVIHIDLPSEETLALLLERLEIPREEIYHVFYNSRLFATRHLHPDLYDLPQAGSKVDDWDLSFELNHGDRIGLFGLDMPVLSM